MNVLKALMRGGATAETDPYFKNTVLLLHGDGTNGAQNNTFVDGSSNNFTLTRNGNPTQGSFSPFGDRWSAYFDGTGDYLRGPSNTAFNLGTGDFTVECWINTLNTSEQIIFSTGYSSAANALFIEVYNNHFCYSPAGSVVIQGATTVTNGAWYHVAVSRSSGNTKLFVNGVQEGATYVDSQNLTQTESVVGIYGVTSGSIYSGYISNLRLVKGTALYTGNFTPPSSPLTAIANTSLLCCHANRFIDGSSNAFTITRNGDTRVTKFAPFAPSAAYSTATDGGSGYFDGAGDYLRTPDNAAFAMGSGDFTVEFWVYLNSFKNYIGFFDARNDGTNTTITPTLYGDVGGGIYYHVQSARITGALVLNQWMHIAVCRSGTSTKMFINGAQAGSTYTDSNNYVQKPWNVGSTALNSVTEDNNYSVPGYMSNFRYIKGTALYTANFTPPTAPLTAVANTQLLCNFTNAAIYDQTGNCVIETLDNAQLSTTSPKFGTASISLDGTSDRLEAPTGGFPSVISGTMDFTIEGWFNVTTNRNYNYLWEVANNTPSSGIFAYCDSGGTVNYAYPGAGTYLTSSVSLSQNTWYHIAFVRSGTTHYIFIDGTNRGQTTASGSVTSGSLVIGGYHSTSVPWLGKIDDFRVTRGYARYTANFTAPTKAFPDQ